MKKTGTVYRGAAKPKADVTIILADDTLTQLAEGKVCLHYLHNVRSSEGGFRKLNGQKAFMTGKLKTKGNVMLATKLDAVLKVKQSCTPLVMFSSKILLQGAKSKL